MQYIRQFDEVTRILDAADHIDVKKVESLNSLPEFIAKMLSYRPFWIAWLYRIRAVLAIMLRLDTKPSPTITRLSASDVPTNPGDVLMIFTLRMFKEEIYWIGETRPDKHLSAHFGVFSEPLSNGRKVYHVATFVRYKQWTGPVYFNIIRPFHHLIIALSARAGSRQ